MTEREAALGDLQFARGMHLALCMVAQGADDKVRALIESMMRDAIRALRASN
jgi:hypothetical protein